MLRTAVLRIPMPVGLVIAALIASPVQLRAQQPPDEAQMRQLMEQAQKMQACMAEVDQAELERLRLEGDAVGEKIAALCAMGKADEARAEAVAYSRKMARSPGFKQMRKCSDAIGDLDFGIALPGPADLESGIDVCAGR